MTTPGTMKKFLSARPAKLRNLGAAANLHERKGSMYSVLIFPLLRRSDDIAADGSHRMSGPRHLTNIAAFPDVCFAAKVRPSVVDAFDPLQKWSAFSASAINFRIVP